MIPRDTSRLCPPYTIPPEYILCYNRDRFSFNHTAVLLSFYIGRLLMPSSLVCEMSVYVVCLCPPEINFYFCFGKFLSIDRLSRIVLYFICWGWSVLYTFLEISRFRLELGFFFSLLDLLTLPCWECIRSYWHCRDTDLYSLVFLWHW